MTPMGCKMLAGSSVLIYEKAVTACTSIRIVPIFFLNEFSWFLSIFYWMRIILLMANYYLYVCFLCSWKFPFVCRLFVWFRCMVFGFKHLPNWVGSFHRCEICSEIFVFLGYNNWFKWLIFKSVAKYWIPKIFIWKSVNFFTPFKICIFKWQKNKFKQRIFSVEFFWFWIITIRSAWNGFKIRQIRKYDTCFKKQ